MRMLAAALLLAATGCASSVSTLQIARPVKFKHVELKYGAGVYVPMGSAVSVIGQGIKQAQAAAAAAKSNTEYVLSEEDQQQLLTGAIGLAVLTPGFAYEMSARTGLAENFDLGLRYNFSSLRLDGKYRLLHGGNGFEPTPPGQVSLATEPAPAPQGPPATRSYDLAIGLGISRYFFNNFIFEALDYIDLANFSRWDFEIPIYLSAEFGEIFKLYGAPKYVYSHTAVDEKLVTYAREATNISGYDVTLPAEVNSHFIGASAGIAVGYKYVHLMLEVTGGYTICNPYIFGQRRSLGGVTIQPAGAINVRF